MHAIVCTGPHISFGVSVVSRYIADPGKEHWEAVKWILSYLKGTVNANIMFDTQHEIGGQITSFVDVDFVGDLDKRRSTTSMSSRWLVDL